MLDSLGNLKRTNYCGELRAAHAGRDVVLTGWVQRRRDLGQLIFLALRDRAGIAQIVCNREQHPAAHQKADKAIFDFEAGRRRQTEFNNPFGHPRRRRSHMFIAGMGVENIEDLLVELRAGTRRSPRTRSRWRSVCGR